MVEKNSSDEDETFYRRYASAPETRKPARKQSGSGSGTLAPLKSTLYVSNVDYSLANSDLHTLFSHFGKIARVTVLKNSETRQSRGFAFVQFISCTDAVSAAGEMHGKILNGRKLSASIASDNGRAAEFIKKREYKDKSRCYECGEQVPEEPAGAQGAAAVEASGERWRRKCCCACGRGRGGQWR